jgi:predicted Kef-type K+ transport protein
MSLVAIIGVSAMTIVPGRGAETFRFGMMFILGAFFAGWLVLALWARSRLRAAPESLPPQWLRRLLVFVSIVYLLGSFFFVLG